jgi:hypothetical protein
MKILRLPLSFSAPLLSTPDTSDCSSLSLLSCRERTLSPGPWSVGLAPVRLLFRGNSRLSQLPRRPLCRFAVLSDPGRTATPNQSSVLVWPPLSQPRRLPHSSFFRGSITRLYGSLPTLEDALSGRQPRLAFGDGSGLAERVFHPWGLDRDFLLLIHVFVSLFLSLFQRLPVSLGFGWRHVIRSG